MAQKKSGKKAASSKKKERDANKAPKEQSNKWQEFLLRHSKKEKQDGKKT